MTPEEFSKLNTEAESLRNTLKAIEAEFSKERQAKSEAIEARIAGCLRMADSFQLNELVFAAGSRCTCGAGLAYPKDIGAWGSWYCSDILLGRAKPGSDPESKQHDAGWPFAFYEIKSENQPSAYGQTTRPVEESQP